MILFFCTEINIAKYRLIIFINITYITKMENIEVGKIKNSLKKDSYIFHGLFNYDFV